MKLRILAGDTPAWIRNHKRSSYITKSFLSAPLWMKRSELVPLRKLADALTIMTGERHVLDHIVPVSHPYVSGLTVPWNMAIITKRQNDRKGNRFAPDQLELF